MSLGRTLKLNTGALMPAVGLGTWQSKPNAVGHAVKVALDAGYRHLDLAHVYCNEAEIGVALKEWFAANPSVKREDIFITSKLWNTFHRPENVIKGLETSLRDLQLDYLDLYLVHWPVAFAPNAENSLAPKNSDGSYADETDKVTVVATWKAMEELPATGKVKAIGVSNYSIATLENLLKHATIVPAVNQVELHPYLPQPELVEYCKQKGIVLTAYSPLGSTGSTPALREDTVVKAIADKHGKTVAQVLISWAVQRGTTVIPKSVTPERIVSNFQDFVLDEEDMVKLNELGKVNLRTCEPLEFWKIDVFNESKPRL
ncbi:hypothetical protein AMAG_09637 [Allomyces macrogynus ATCC 38327]|uniref:NADP-dependent oxidoreductase domain-containing protein n=1 Tax=Allomyces macrogynus (strain ATCC 38327) TaxID=578462 RepID=A0A0L0STD1_ALLM3|nr:hypothetical protein AMAG_09637 [Allomyces macrogynus ATCC 38327]|eukprot:KNE65655.1 hypothetical protein AMAG_09637 [Allomyces macrogynus ATCC 38327]